MPRLSPARRRAPPLASRSLQPLSSPRPLSFNPKSPKQPPKAHGGFSVFAGVGERTREGNDLYREMIESGVIKLGEERGKSKCTLVYGQMNEPPGARARVALTGLTVAEYFRDVEGQDVLFFVDNIFRFTQARCVPRGGAGHRAERRGGALQVVVCGSFGGEWGPMAGC